MQDSLVLQAFEGQNKHVPVWFMRQAGRFLPEYRAIKKERTLEEMFREPEVASRITLLPVELLNVDAAILFADILTLPSAMGFDIKFVDGKGPVIANPIKSPQDIDNIHNFDELNYVSETIGLVNRALPKNVPLIGFAGSPLTVAQYLIGSTSSLGLPSVVRFMMEHPADFHRLMQKLTKNTIEYLVLQKKAGIRLFQLFDTWAGTLRASDYREFVLPYVKEIFSSVDLPSIYYLKNCAHLLREMVQTNSDFLSVCDSVEIGHNEILNSCDQGIQGNLYNGLLYVQADLLLKEVRQILQSAQKYHKKYIFNLSHGVFPDTSVDRVKDVIAEVKRFKWNG
ncbi:MAG: uroporphyrinogen decarboxylase [Candidatus Omnitrophica bacterium]|nr:uroporphyrinogen decarboxylase [Candidatus Omnitrophota bacterium]